MRRKLLISVLSVAILAIVVIGFILVRPFSIANASRSFSGDPAARDSATLTGTYYWSYAAKFVCGYQSPGPATAPLPGEPVVKPGNYATEINIQNPNFKLIPLIKRVIVLVDGDKVVREPQSAGPSGGEPIELQGNFATMDDCNRLWVLTHPQSPVLPSPMPLFVGYLVILSPLDINVTAVYTTNAPGIAGQPPTSNSIEVLTVTGKRIFLPTGTNP